MGDNGDRTLLGCMVPISKERGERQVSGSSILPTHLPGTGCHPPSLQIRYLVIVAVGDGVGHDACPPHVQHDPHGQHGLPIV